MPYSCTSSKTKYDEFQNEVLKYKVPGVIRTTVFTADSSRNVSSLLQGVLMYSGNHNQAKLEFSKMNAKPTSFRDKYYSAEAKNKWNEIASEQSAKSYEAYSEAYLSFFMSIDLALSPKKDGPSMEDVKKDVNSFISYYDSSLRVGWEMDEHFMTLLKDITNVPF